MNRFLKLALPRIGARAHGATDYIHTAAFLLMGALMMRRNRPAAVAALTLGGGVLANALCTDYPYGLFRLYSFRTHGVMDYGIAALSAAAPRIGGFEHTRAARYFKALGVGETLIASATNYEDDTGSRDQGSIYDRMIAA